MVIVTLASLTSEVMIMTELLIYPALALMMLLFIYIIIGPRDQMVRYINHNLDINIDKCASEDCVR